ncbi:hypothetical protein [Nonomuraea sp. NPDC052265]|uniref:hypothetical protein n=1 Tax=Nonomuraea sp. NPDC052265 TaxID=3364374 RepID=UPI0037C6C032
MPAAIARLRESGDQEGFLICDSVTGQRLGNITLLHDGQSGEVSYWVAAEARRTVRCCEALRCSPPRRATASQSARRGPADPAPVPLAVGPCVRRADLRRPLVAALWS